MENLIFCLNATVPVFLLMVLGMILRKAKLLDTAFTAKLNKFVFTVPLPVLLFQDMGNMDFSLSFDLKFLSFCFLATALSIGISLALSFLFFRGDAQGEFVQASYRSSAALLGIAFIENLYGTSEMAPLMILGSVPLYNIAAVIVLTVMKPGKKEGLTKHFFVRLAKDIVTNPIILGIAAGSLWSLSGLSMPVIMEKTVNNIAAMATPLGLIAMGASFHTNKALAKWKPVACCTFLKLAGFCALFLPLAIRLGFTGEKLVSILIMLASPTTVSCYIMVKNMGYEGDLTAGTTLLSTLFGAFTLTGWLFFLKTGGLI